jgi:hypothetical protein
MGIEEEWQSWLRGRRVTEGDSLSSLTELIGHFPLNWRAAPDGDVEGARSERGGGGANNNSQLGRHLDGVISDDT